MSFHFNWDRLDHLTSDVLMSYINDGLAAKFSPNAKKDKRSDAVEASTTDILGTSNNLSRAPYDIKSPPSTPSGGAIQALRLTSLSFGGVPPFLELVVMDDALDFSEMPAHATELGGGGSSNINTSKGHPSNSGKAAASGAQHQVDLMGSFAQTDDESNRIHNSDDPERDDDSLAALFGTSGMFLKFHFTYGGDASVGVEAVVRHFIHLGGTKKNKGEPHDEGLSHHHHHQHGQGKSVADFHGGIKTPNALLSTSSPPIVFPVSVASPTTVTTATSATSTTDYELASGSPSEISPNTRRHPANQSTASEEESTSSPVHSGNSYYQSTAIYNTSPQHLLDCLPTGDTQLQATLAATHRNAATSVPLTLEQQLASKSAPAIVNTESLGVTAPAAEAPFGIGLSLPLHVALSGIALEGYICVNIHQNECKVWLEPGAAFEGEGFGESGPLFPSGSVDGSTDNTLGGGTASAPATPIAGTLAPPSYFETRTPLSRINVELIAGPKALSATKKRSGGTGGGGVGFGESARASRMTQSSSRVADGGRNFFYNGQHLSSGSDEDDSSGNEGRDDGPNGGLPEGSRGLGLFGYSTAAQNRKAGRRRDGASNSGKDHTHHGPRARQDDEADTFVDQQFVTQLVYAEMQALLRHYLVMPRYTAFPMKV